MDWSGIHFYADANTECQTDERMRRFNEIYYDVNGALNALLSEPNLFLISGNKGMGKTATLKKLECLANEPNSDLITLNFSLQKLNYNEFSAFINNHFSDNWRFYDTWLFLYHVFLARVFQEISRNTNIRPPAELPLLLADLRNNGLIEICGSHALHVERINLRASMVEVESSINKINQWSTAVLNYYQDILSRVNLRNKKLIVVLDGLDDFLKTHRPDDGFFWDMIRAARDLNAYYLNNVRNGWIKFIIAIREDVIDGINDSDSNKTFQDGLIRINWNKNSNHFFSKDILGMLFKRFHKAGLINSETQMEDFLKQYFCGNASSLYYSFKAREIYNLTLNRPRDVLMLFESCKREYPYLDTLNDEQFNRVKKKYSRTHFMVEMKNELLYILNKDIVANITRTIENLLLNNYASSSTNGEFSKNLWKTTFLKANTELSEQNAMDALEQLFSHGYVGAIIKTGQYYSNPYSNRNEQQYYEFISEDQFLSFNQIDNFLIHYINQADYNK